MQSVRIDLGDRSYDAVIAPGVLASIGPRTRELVPGARRAFMATDAGLPAPLIERAAESLRAAGLAVCGASVVAREREKSLASCEVLLTEMANERLERSDVLIALGGGLTGDLAGFAAATYMRGVAFIQCPTTLLSMVDASVGGKTGVNLVTGSGITKNMVGAFWQPALVLADLDTLASLPPRVFRAGWGEMLKHALIAGAADPDLWNDTLRALTTDPVAAPPRGSLAPLIARNIRFKASIVAGDERETAPSHLGGRALLNLGHTFAHAIEPLPHLSPSDDPADAPLHHGEAVALGLICAAATAHSLGLVPEAFVESVRAAVERLNIRTRLPELPSDVALSEAMRHDKKARAGRPRLVVPVPRGEHAFAARVIESPDPGAIASGWAAIRA